jgi:putative ABC transport system permease protein
MNGRTLIQRSLRHHWRSHLGVLLGAAVATAILVGALAVGDSVRFSLRQTALDRIGKTEVALIAPDRLFSEALADRLDRTLFPPETFDRRQGSRAGPTSAMLLVRGVAARPDGTARIGGVQLLGCDEWYFPLMQAEKPAAPSARGAFVNQVLAARLGVKVGEEIVLRIPKVSALSIDAPLTAAGASTVSLRFTVDRILSAKEGGGFGLAANQVQPPNVLVPLPRLQKALALANSANVILAGPGPYGDDLSSGAGAALAKALQPADTELAFRVLPNPELLEVRSRRIFLDPPVGPAAVRVDEGAVGILTYFVNELKVGGHTTPYSMVTAIGPLGPPAAARNPILALLSKGMADDQVVINAWLAEDLAAKAGDELELSYYVIGQGNRLETRSARFRIAAVVPLEGAAADRTLMPDFPGIAEAESSHDWQTDIPIDMNLVRPKDEGYWHAHRGTPKAFVTLGAGQKMWGNRFGNLTALRMPGLYSQAPAQGADAAAENAAAFLSLSGLAPADFGLHFQDVRARALAASAQGTDFGSLFLGLSLFLVIAALVLTGLLFALGVEQRAEEVGVLLALGLGARRVRRLLLIEGAVPALVGGAIGAAAGLLYTRGMLYALATVWQGAVGAADIRYDANPVSVAGGAAAGFLVALGAVWLSVRRQARAPARELLASGAEAELRTGGRRQGASRRRGLVLGAAGIVGAVAIFVLAQGARGEAAAGAFFGAGALLLVAGLGLCQAVLASMARTGGPDADGRATACPPRRASRGRPRTEPAGRDETRPSDGRTRRNASLHAPARFSGLALRNATRRRGRSLATASLLACGVFLVITVAANQRDPLYEADRRSSGTGGFALYGEATLPVVKDLNSADGRKAYALPENLKDAMSVVPLRIHEGDDASCLNLNRAQTPRLWGVDPEPLASRGAFAFAEVMPDLRGRSWELLNPAESDGAVPAVADQNTATWALGKAVGDTLDYTDEQGRPFRVRIVALLENSILQGGLVISEANLLARFPSTTGYRAFLIDSPGSQAGRVSEVLSRQLSDVGLALAPATERLAAFGAVENTYLAIFQALGGLALALGSIGLGVVVLRNVLERRGELALLRAVGFSRRSLYWMILSEHWALLAMGLVCGVTASLGAVVPLVSGAGARVPFLSLSLTLAAVLAAGMVWTLLATRLALKGPLLAALRSE